ncbi:MAG: hypothetical protein GTN82_02795 [Candidatus Aminicenantes bacterium]|nr:hypothetical protein [Candidatus Aminicenantes bacterium]
MKQVKIMAILFLLMFVNVSHAAMILNYSCTAFSDQCTTSGDRSNGITIGEFIVVGGGYFLESHSNLKLLLSQVELSDIRGIDYAKTRDILYRAIDKMERANTIYLALKNMADEIEYNPEVLNRLTGFDYDGFREAFDLNPTVFKKAEDFLSKGNVRGVYNEIFIETGNILEKLYIVRESLEANMFPAVSNLWRINQKYAELELFGQYVAEVFYKLKGSK